jgi:hypothetical protein
MKGKWSLFLILLVATAPAFAQAPKAGPASVGLTVVVHDREMFANGLQNASNWEAYTSAFGDGTLALATNTEAEATEGTERGVVAFFNADGTVVETDGFFTDAGAAWTGNNDGARTDGNPPRIGADKRPGGTKYVFGNESTPWIEPGLFPSYVASGFSYNAQVASVQLLNKVGNTPTPIGKVLDPINGKLTTGAQDNQMRFGGEIRGLSNGNFAVVVDNRDTAFGNAFYGSPVRTYPFAIIDQNTGLVTVGPLSGNQVPLDPNVNSGGWSNLAAYKDGFAIRNQDNSSTIDFWDNNGTALGTWDRTLVRTDPAEPLAPANGKNTSISDNSGGSSRIDSHINSNYIYWAAKGVGSDGTPNTGVYVTKIDARTRATVKEAMVNNTFVAAPDRVNVCSDKNDNVFVCWSDSSNTGKKQIIGRAYDANLDPITDAFLVFEHSDLGPDEVVGFAVKHPSCSMVDYRVLVTGRIDNDAGGVESLELLSNAHYAVVFQLPSPASVDGWTQY